MTRSRPGSDRPEVGEEGELVVAFEIGDLRLEGRAHRHHRCALLARVRLDRVEQRVVVEATLRHVGDVHRRLHRQQEEWTQHGELLRVQLGGTRRPTLVQHDLDLLQRRDEALRLLVAAGTRRLLVLRELLLDRREIGERELGVDRLDVRHRIDLAGDVHDVVVAEAPHDMRDRVGLTDVGEELVAEALALGRARHEAGDVDEFHHRRKHALGLCDGCKRAEARIGHLDDADVRLDRAEGIVLGRDAGLGEGVEQRGLAHVGQADDAAFETHGISLRVCSSSMARSMSPTAIAGHASSPRWIAASMGARSSARGGRST